MDHLPIQTSGSALLLVSHHLCPYVQRATIALAEKGVPFERVNIDLADKPRWFLEISPLGKVPLLCIRHSDGNQDILFESSVICEYLEETQDGHRLHAADALTRARHRGWMEFGSSILSDLWVYETTQDRMQLEAKRQVLASKFATIETELRSGPYFAGDSFSMVDTVFAPIFRYFDVFDAIGDSGVFAGLPSVQAWRTALSERPSVKAAVGPDYADRLMAFLKRHDAVLLQQPSVSAA
ncbi:glutathione S-transferase family protein [Rhizobium sp. 3T7]|uniref:glutathione S-transferase family protein n=1 Tax=Rhizobium sp. 3T7 TaxID=2874922 RepID=UPI001CC93247|nr:glutathione S-transferase family protein [Rhizobium sp. 3T7]MBZ9789765.1 glutathione S-transferase family protein [Rhizobium sp. 3T7]